MSSLAQVERAHSVYPERLDHKENALDGWTRKVVGGGAGFSPPPQPASSSARGEASRHWVKNRRFNATVKEGGVDENMG